MAYPIQNEKAQLIASAVVEGAARISSISSEQIANSSLLKKRIFRRKATNHRMVRLLKRKAIADQAIQNVKAMMSAYFSAIDIAVIAATPAPAYQSGTRESVVSLE